MQIYFAGTLGIVSREEQLIRLYEHRLLSFWDIQEDQFAVKKSFELIKNENIFCRRRFRKETFKLIIGEKTDAKKKKNQRNKST